MLAKIKNSLKKNPNLYFLVWLLRDKDLRNNYIDYYWVGNKITMKSRSQVRRELNLIRGYWKCPAYHYFRYKLYNQDLTDQQLLEYVPAYYFYNYHMADVYRNLDLSIIENKIKAHRLFTNKGIPTATLIGYVEKKQIYDNENKPISVDKLINLMNTSNSDRFFCKPLTGKGGRGIFVLSKNNGELMTFGNSNLRRYLVNAFNKGDYIIQEGLVQRSDISLLNSSSVNTLRIITQIRDDIPQISIAILRIGRKSMFVDNSAKGGISVEVDQQTGQLYRFGFTEHNMNNFEEHPDNGIVFKNFIINNWDFIGEKICQYAEKLKIYKELAWDVAISSDNVIVIEVNSYYGIDHLQCCSGGVAKKLNLKNP